ncbi:uncharacterized protein DMENIID0001_087500 [Sergentomyia squamirostris]
MDPLKKVVAVLRGIIISNPFSTTLQDLMMEYRDSEGCGIPFREFECQSVEEFLLSTDSIEIQRKNGLTFVRAKPKAETEHLVKMIAAQKKSKPKKRGGAFGSGPSEKRPTVTRRKDNYPSWRSSSSSISMDSMAESEQLIKPTRPENKKRIKINTYHCSTRSRVHDPPAPSSVIPGTQAVRPSSSAQNAPSLPRTRSRPYESRPSSSVTTTPPCIQAPVLPTPDPEIFVLNNDTQTPIEDLEKYCRYIKYNEPEYKFSCVTLRGRKIFQCRVILSNKSFSTHSEHSSKLEAQTAGAQIAIQELIKKKDLMKKYPLCCNKDDIAGYIKEMLKFYPDGVLEAAIPDYFRKRFNMILPENWLDLISTCNSITVEKIGNRKFIYPKNSNISGLHLPWAMEEWKIKITNAVSTTKVYGRIIDQYSNRFDSLMKDIKMTEMTSQPHDEVQEGQIYLVMNDTNWIRVKVEVIDQENQSYHCFCIDSGEQEVYTELYECSQEYLKFPNQAIKFSLVFLKDLEGHPFVKPHLDEILVHSQFLAKVLTKQDEFEENNGVVPIEVVLMNPNSPDLDVNINQIILEKVCNETPAPQLKRSSISCVKITHVSDDGDVFCQMKEFDTGLNYIQRLIDNVVIHESKISLSRTIEREDPSIRYLIRDRTSGKWYRAVPVTPVSLMKFHHRMYCIDYGFILDVPCEDICQLEPLSKVLYNFPALAIECRLYGLQSLSTASLLRIKALLFENAEDSECVLKMMVSTSSIPQVNCYQLHKNGFCINESVQIHEEIERENKLSPSSSPRSLYKTRSSMLTAYA